MENISNRSNTHLTIDLESCIHYVHREEFNRVLSKNREELERFNKQKLELLNESISLTTSLNQQNHIIKSRKAEIKLSETKIQNLLKKSRNLENNLGNRILEISDKTKNLREEFLKIDGIQEIQIRKKIRRKGSMDSPTKKWGDSRVKVKGEGEWNLAEKMSQKFKKRAPKRSSTFIEDKNIAMDIVDCSKKIEKSDLGYLGLSKEVKDTWDFGDKRPHNRGVFDGGVTVIKTEARVGLGSAKNRKIKTLDSSFNSFDDHSSDGDSSSKMTKNAKKGNKSKPRMKKWNAGKDKGAYHLKSGSFYDSKKKPNKSRKMLANNVSFKSKSQLMQDNNYSLMDNDIDLQDPAKGYCKVIPTKLEETRMKKQELVKLYKRLMPEAKLLIKELKARKDQILKVNSKISGFIDKLDNNLNQKYRCKKCFKKFVINENQHDSCRYHPGKVKFYSCRKCGDDEYYTCCNKCDRCNPGCKVAPHIPFLKFKDIS